MIELVDTFPDISVQPAEYKRLLGYPPDRVVEGRARELSDWARNWYSQHGRPWVYARHCDHIQTQNGCIEIGGAFFHSARLQSTLRQAQAHAAILVAVSAGQELEQEAQKLWWEEKPDEYFFLEVFGSAVVEHLTTMTGARLCAWAENHNQAVLPHYSPGYPEWDIAEQPRLLTLIKQTHKQDLPSEIEVLETGMLRPKKSLLAVFGLTHHTQTVRKLSDLVPCENCSFLPCQYRRSPYQGAALAPDTELSVLNSAASAGPVSSIARLDRSANYTINVKALQRWAEERLSLTTHPDGAVDAVFRYDGTTCTNMGRPLAFEYFVKLGPREEGYPIRQQHCQPASGDSGHTYMCRYMNNAEHLMVAIDRENPLAGRPLNDVLSWQRPNDMAGCYCEPASRKHKWGLVLETIHYALVQRENGEPKK
jgi:hypothetical protein